MNRYLIGAAVLAVALAAGAVQAQYTPMSIEDTSRSATLTGLTVGTVARSGAATTSYGVGTALTNTVATEYDLPVHMTTITLDTDFVAVDAANNGETELIYVFPAGRIYVLGAAIDATVVNNTNCTEATANDVYYVGVGTTAAAGTASDLATTTQDIIAKTTITTDSGAVLSTAWEADMTCGADTVHDGTSTAIDLHLNLAIADTSLSSENMTNTITGTLNLYWVNLGDD